MHFAYLYIYENEIELQILIQNVLKMKCICDLFVIVAVACKLFVYCNADEEVRLTQSNETVATTQTSEANKIIAISNDKSSVIIILLRLCLQILLSRGMNHKTN